ncbi:hypothetical protein ACVGXE_09540, partial [Escherichia coli]
DTACGLQAEKTGRFSLHWRDNTRPDKTRQRRIRHRRGVGGAPPAPPPQNINIQSQGDFIQKTTIIKGPKITTKPTIAKFLDNYFLKK